MNARLAVSMAVILGVSASQGIGQSGLVKFTFRGYQGDPAILMSTIRMTRKQMVAQLRKWNEDKPNEATPDRWVYVHNNHVHTTVNFDRQGLVDRVDIDWNHDMTLNPTGAGRPSYNYGPIHLYLPNEVSQAITDLYRGKKSHKVGVTMKLYANSNDLGRSYEKWAGTPTFYRPFQVTFDGIGLGRLVFDVWIWPRTIGEVKKVLDVNQGRYRYDCNWTKPAAWLDSGHLVGGAEASYGEILYRSWTLIHSWNL